MKLCWTTLVALAVLFAAEVAHEGLTSAEGGEEARRRAAASLDQLPARIGDWSSEELEIDERQLRIGQIDGCRFRRYVNTADGTVVHLLAVTGRPGPISVHTPDICFRGAGYAVESEPARVALRDAADQPMGEFHVADFVRDSGAVTRKVRVFWTWDAAEGWEAPEIPRLAFADRPVLHKLYVTQGNADGGEIGDDDPAVRFLRELHPHWRSAFDR